MTIKYQAPVSQFHVNRAARLSLWVWGLLKWVSSVFLDLGTGNTGLIAFHFPFLSDLLRRGSENSQWKRKVSFSNWRTMWPGWLHDWTWQLSIWLLSLPDSTKSDQVPESLELFPSLADSRVLISFTVLLAWKITQSPSFPPSFTFSTPMGLL
jgi:hypothetical protein